MDIKEVVNNQREFYNKHILDDINVRIKKLKQLKKIIIENEKEINDFRSWQTTTDEIT